MKWQKKLKDIIEECHKLEKKVSGDHQLLKEYGQIAPKASLAKAFLSLQVQIEDQEKFLEESRQDQEMSQLISQELENLNLELDKVKSSLSKMLTPKDERDDKDAFIEIRAGTGGIEASLFCGDLVKMYLKYCERKDWRFSFQTSSRSDLGGYKECVGKIEGNNVYGYLKFESGVHRVQRVPFTESSGRIHTSAVTVVVLPVVGDSDFHLDEKDVRVDVFKASGAGGQHVNKTESAVRLTHIPTGIVTVQQSERSQYRNKQKAMEILRAKIYEFETRKKQEEIAETRKSLVGSGDRSQKVRTYNFPQNRVTDHRINWTSHNLEDFLNGGDEFSSLIQKLMEEEGHED